MDEIKSKLAPISCHETQYVKMLFHMRGRLGNTACLGMEINGCLFTLTFHSGVLCRSPQLSAHGNK